VKSRLIAAAPLLLCAVSCGGDGVVVDTGGPPTSGPTLTSLQTSIFTPKCAVAGCHAAPAPQQGMDLAAGRTYVYTVNADTVELPQYKRVAPGLSADSYLYMKISGDPRIVGDRMPLGGTLTAAEIDSVRAWIDAGALDD